MVSSLDVSDWEQWVGYFPFFWEDKYLMIAFLYFSKSGKFLWRMETTIIGSIVSYWWTTTFLNFAIFSRVPHNVLPITSFSIKTLNVSAYPVGSLIPWSEIMWFAISIQTSIRICNGCSPLFFYNYLKSLHL